MRRLSQLFRQRPWWLLLLGFLAIEAVYLFVISAGHFTHWPDREQQVAGEHGSDAT